MIPASEMDNAPRNACLMKSVCSCVPMTNMYSTRPSWLTTESTLREAAGNSADCRDGASRPSSEGPRRIPASISPTTLGWRTRGIAAPTSRQTSRMHASCRKNWRASCWLVMSAAGRHLEQRVNLRRDIDAAHGLPRSRADTFDHERARGDARVAPADHTLIPDRPRILPDDL